MTAVGGPGGVASGARARQDRRVAASADPAAGPTHRDDAPVASPDRLPVPAAGVPDAAAADAAGGELAVTLAERVRDYARAARASSTWKAYDTDLRQFRSWCAAQ